MSASNIQEENEQSNDVTPNTAQNELPSLDTYNNTASSVPGNDSGVILTTPDGTEWLQITPGKYSAIRHSKENILREVSGPTPYVKRNVVAGSSASAWRLLIYVCMSDRSMIYSHVLFRYIVKSSRSQRLQTNKFALFSKIWNRFTDNCCTLSKSGAFITVDKQLFPSKARRSFIQ